MYDDYIGGQPSSAIRTAPAAQAPQVLQTLTASTTTADTTPTPTNSSSQAKNIPNTSQDKCYVDGTKCNDNIVCHRQPPTKAWTTELLSEREAKELSCGGFGHRELEEDFVFEEGDLIPNNIEVVTTQELMVEALNDVGFQAQRNEEVEVGVSEIGVNEQTPGSGKDLMELTKNRVLTQKAFESVADEVERSIEKSKIMEIDDRQSNIMRSPFYSRVADADAALSSEEGKVTKYLYLTNHESE
nr:hypothetical protein [Tanacetum cinerariifolium]